jgi:hypothetical protein
MAPRLHPESSHVNLTGYPAVDAAGSDRVRRIIAVPNRPIYAEFDLRRIDPKAVKRTYANQLALWGLKFTEDKCNLVLLKRPADWAWLNQLIRLKLRYDPPEFQVCSLHRASREDQERALSEYRDFSHKVAQFGANCPQYFGKPLGYVHTDKGWVVTSFASAERRMVFLDAGPIYLQQARPPHVALQVGVSKGGSMVATEPDCNVWFSRISEMSDRESRGEAASDSN